MSNLLLAEHDYQVQDFIKRGLHIDAEWIALGPSAMHYLSKKGITYTIPEDYCSLEDIESACVAQFERIKRVCERMDNEILEKDSFLREWGIRPFLFHLWQIGMILDALISRSIWLNKMIENFPEARVYTHLAEAQPWEVYGLGFGKRETLWGRLLSLTAWKNEVITLPEPSASPARKSSSEKLKGFLKGKVTSKIKSDFRLMNIVLSFRYAIPMIGLKAFFLRQLNKYMDVVVLGAPCEWQYILSSLIKGKRRIFFLDQVLFKKTLPEETSRHIETEALWNKFCQGIQIESTDYRPIIKDRVCWIIENSSNIARTVIDKMVAITSAMDIRLLINCGATYFSDYVVKQYFIKKNIHVLGWQHGSIWFDKRITQRADLLYILGTTDYLTYGNSVKKAYESSNFKNACKIDSVGSISLDRIGNEKKSTMNSGCRILYVITTYYRNAWYCGFSPPFSDRLYFREQSIIINRLKDMANAMHDISVTVKLHPNPDILDDDPSWTDDLKNEKNIYLKRNPDFIQMLDSHDMVIIDSPTTTLLQAISTQLPVFVLTSVATPPRDDIPILKRRAICADSAKELMNELERYLKTGQYNADEMNRDYLKLYGTHLDDGKSTNRSINIVERFLN